jgi:hypothetical protein
MKLPHLTAAGIENDSCLIIEIGDKTIRDHNCLTFQFCSIIHNDFDFRQNFEKTEHQDNVIRFEIPENDVRSRHDREETAVRLKQVEDIQRREVPQGANMAEWALAWCLKHPAVQKRSLLIL